MIKKPLFIRGNPLMKAFIALLFGGVLCFPSCVRDSHLESATPLTPTPVPTPAPTSETTNDPTQGVNTGGMTEGTGVTGATAPRMPKVNRTDVPVPGE